MRAIKSSLAIIWLLMLVIVAGSALFQRHAGRVNEKRFVYVDRDKLVVLHPAWQQVLSIRAAIADLKGEAAKPVYKGSISSEDIKDLKAESAVKGRSRQELTHELEQRAFSELAYFESRERKKIEQDIAAKRLELEAAMQTAVAQKSEELKLRIASEERSVQSERSTGRLETELRIASIKSRLKALSASDQQRAKRDLADAQGTLSEFDSQTQKCVSDQCQSAKDELQRFTVRERLRLENELSQLRAERENQLEKSIRNQQEILLAGIQAGADENNPVSVVKRPVSCTRERRDWPAADIAAATSKTKDDAAEALQKLKTMEQRLVSRIISDITSTAQSVAEEQGFTVTFKRGKAAEDYTKRIAGVISSLCAKSGKGRAG